MLQQSHQKTTESLTRKTIYIVTIVTREDIPGRHASNSMVVQNGRTVMVIGEGVNQVAVLEEEEEVAMVAQERTTQLMRSFNLPQSALLRNHFLNHLKPK